MCGKSSAPSGGVWLGDQSAAKVKLSIRKELAAMNISAGIKAKCAAGSAVVHAEPSSCQSHFCAKYLFAKYQA